MMILNEKRIFRPCTFFKEGLSSPVLWRAYQMKPESIQHEIGVFCCQNPQCPTFGQRQKGNLRFCGWSGKSQKIRMIYCDVCQYHFSERKGTVLWESRLSQEKALSLLDHIREGCGTRTTSRLLHLSKDTVTRFIRISGSHSQKVHNELVSFSPTDKRNSGR